MDIARTEIIAFDADGNPVDPDSPDMLTGEQTEYDADDNVIRRLYLRAGTIDTDAPWNLVVEGRPVETLNDLLVWAGATDTADPRNRDRVAACMLLASWVNAPDELQSQVYAYLAG